MAWVIKQDVTPFATVYFDMTPPCAEIRPPPGYFQEHGLPYGNIAMMGVEIEDRFWPKSARLKTARTKLPHLLGFCSFYGFSQSWVDEIDALEPQKHEFRRIETTRRDGSALEETYYAVNIREIIQGAVDFEASEAPSKDYGSVRMLLPLRDCDSGRVVMNGSIIKEKHLWLARDVGLSAIAVSDTLLDRLQEKNLLAGVRKFKIVETSNYQGLEA